MQLIQNNGRGLRGILIACIEKIDLLEYHQFLASKTNSIDKYQKPTKECCSDMKQHLKYLNELEQTFTALTNTQDEQSFPPLGVSGCAIGDVSGPELLDKLLIQMRTFQTQNPLRNNDELFIKYLDVISLLLKVRPYLLKSKICDVIDVYFEISVTQFENIHRRWFLRRKIGTLCKNCVSIYGFSSKKEISLHILHLAESVEEGTKVLFREFCGAEEFIFSLKRLFILSFWLCSPLDTFGNSINILNSSTNYGSWNYYFQTLIRHAFYIFDSVQLSSYHLELSNIKLNFLGLIIDNLSKPNSSYTFTPQSPFFQDLVFALVSLRKFLFETSENVLTNDDIILSKYILRIYFLCISSKPTSAIKQTACLLLFKRYFPFLQLLNNDNLTNPEIDMFPFLFHTNKALLLVYFDIKRREIDSTLLKYNKISRIWSYEPDGDKILANILSHYSSSSSQNSRQLEKLHHAILTSFNNEDYYPSGITFYNEIQSSIIATISCDEDLTLKVLSKRISTAIKNNDSQQLTIILSIMSTLICYEMPNSKFVTLPKGDQCYICDASEGMNLVHQVSPTRSPVIHSSNIYNLLCEQYLLPKNIENLNENLIASILLLLHKIFIHFDPPSLTDSENGDSIKSTEKQNIFGFITSYFLGQNRYLRILSSRIIPLWNISEHNNCDGRQTSMLISFLQANNFRYMTATLLYTWAQLTLTTSNQTYRSLLVKLIDFFKSSNFSRYASATFQIRNISNIKSITPYQLVSPILPKLLSRYGINSLKKLSFERLTNLLEQSPGTTLGIYQRYIVPYAVILQQKPDVFSEMAGIMCGDPKEINNQKSLLLKQNSRQIFAVSFVKYGMFDLKFLENVFTNRLSSFDKRFVVNTLPDFKTLAEVLKMYKMDAAIKEDERKLNEYRVLRTLRYLLTNFDEDKRNGRKYLLESWDVEQEKKFQQKLQENVLGIFQVFSSDMRHIEGRTSYIEKEKVINGISFLIIHASKDTIISALAQISVCLQTALDLVEVRLKALNCWKLLLSCLTTQELSIVIDGPISFIFHNWGIFDHQLRLAAYEILDKLVEEHQSIILEIKPGIMLGFINHSEMKMLERDLNFGRILKRTVKTIKWMSVFAESLRSRNKYVIDQTLQYLEEYLNKHLKDPGSQVFLLPENKDHIAALLDALLNASIKYKSTNDDICQRCAKCISMLGLWDLSDYQFELDPLNELRVFDLEESEQTADFIILLINKILVPMFWECETPSRQLVVAFVLQESLKFCKLSLLEDPDISLQDTDIWYRFNSISQTTLSPLLSSMYLLTEKSEYTPLSYPILQLTDDYVSWIKLLTLDLLKRTTDTEHPLQIFPVLINEDDDGEFCKFLLPYICMDIIVKASPNTPFLVMFNDIQKEFLSVFDYNLETLNHIELDGMRLRFNTIFRIFEYCKKWVAQSKKSMSENQQGTSKIKEKKIANIFQRVEQFVSTIPLKTLASKSLKTDAFERSALYLEQCFRQGDVSFSEDENMFKSLQRTYEEIGDIDSVDGFLKTFSKNSLRSKIEELQYSDSWKIAKDCYEALGEFENDPGATTKMLNIMYEHQQYPSILENLESLVYKDIENVTPEMIKWFTFGLESANLEGKVKFIKIWTNRIEKLPKIASLDMSFHYNIAKSLLSIHDRNNRKASKYITKCLSLLGSYMASTSTSATSTKKQELLLKLHGVYDLSLLIDSYDNASEKVGIDILGYRRERMGASFFPNYYVLSLRKSFNLMLDSNTTRDDLVSIYYDVAKLCRNNSRETIASKALMHCKQKGYAQAELEFAEILWNQGENDRALKLVKEIHLRNESQHHKTLNIKSKERAAVLLKYTEWTYLSNNASSNQIIKQYHSLFELQPNWDKPFYSMGVYYSRLLERKITEGYITNGSLERFAVVSFLEAFDKNIAKVRETLPKVVTYWLDIAAAAETERKSLRKKSLVTATEAICNEIKKAMTKCPIYIWYVVLTQLLSRLLHSNKETAELIRSILIHLVNEYPQHIFWYIFTLLESKDTNRHTCGKYILSKYKDDSNSIQPFKNSARSLVHSLIKICIGERKISRTLERDFKFDISLAPSELVVPVKINLEMLSPMDSMSRKNYNPFHSIVSIHSIGSNYKIFSSLKKPKQINMVGSDGMIYGIMCKKEDVRQDNQYMQFATTVNFLLKKNTDAMKRNLDVTTYSVLSLREDCGLLEIVPHVDTLRNIFINKYSGMGINLDLKKTFKTWKDTSDKLEFFESNLKEYPPVLYQWFLEAFPNPIEWFKARNIFARSTAVMSMIGYILGLGDRHCENILLDIETGKLLHVDFDCLFEKGKKLAVPEIVPFRLTQNMNDALGIVRTEGTFKKSSEVTISVMRNNELALMNVIETIVYDRNMDESIKSALKVVKNKVRGMDENDGLVLSVAGQVEVLIQEATSKENLSNMYIGWLPFW